MERAQQKPAPALLVHALLVLAFAVGPSQESGAAVLPQVLATDDDFVIAETLMTPTHESVTLRMTPRTDMVVSVHYGLSSQHLDASTPPRSLAAGEPFEVVLRGLRANTRYSYRVHYATAATNGRSVARGLHAFTTLPPPGRPFSFAYATDSHHYEGWADDQFAAKPGAQLRFLKTIDNMRHRNPRWLVIGGDHVQTQCSCEGGTHDGISYAQGSAKSEQEARNRYNVTFGAEGFGGVTSDIPFVYVLGNHDGEGGWYSNALFSSSQAARFGTLANPSSVYTGHPDGYYYAFESGDALIVVIDVMRFTTVKPPDADGWTLGADQMLWLSEVLRQSRAKWTFIFAEHLVGGEPTPILLGANYYYGRGGLRATEDDPTTADFNEENKIWGPFKGEQALIQWLEEQHNTDGGATFFLSGHDHVAITPTEKLDIQGNGTRTYHVKGGRAGYYGPSWAATATFKKEMDWNLNGIADYDEPDLGSRKAGFFMIHVNGADSVTFEYILTDTGNELLDNTVAFSKTIEAVDT